MIANDRSEHIGRHQASLADSLIDIAATLDGLAVPVSEPSVRLARDSLMSTYAYTAARNELASLVKLTERALVVANHCKQPEIIALLSKAFVGATAARNDLMTRRRESILAA